MPSAQAFVQQDVELTSCLKKISTNAVEAYEYALSWEDRSGGDNARLCQAQAMVALQNYQAAAAQFHKVALSTQEKQPAIAVELFSRSGHAYLLSEEYPQAIASFKLAHLLVPDDSEILFDLASATYLEGQYQQALSYFLKVEATSLPENQQEDFFVTFGRAYESFGQKDQALKVFKEGLKEIEDGAYLKLHSARILILEGKKEDARHFLKELEAQTLEPDLTEMVQELSLYVQQN